MMKQTNHTLLFLFSLVLLATAQLWQSNAVQAQNLVPNPGFEEHHFDSVLYWEQPIGSYYHFEVNSNSAHSGDCLNGICLWRNEVSEYLLVKLTSPLVKNKRYEVTAYTMKDMWEPRMYLSDSIDHIGIYFSKDKFEVRYKKYLFFKPQIELNVYVDSLWSKTHGYFVASGDEKYMIMGRFFELSEVHTSDIDTAVEHILRMVENLDVERSKALKSGISEIDEKYKKIQADSWNISSEKSVRKQEKMIENFRNTMLGKQIEVKNKTIEINNKYGILINELNEQYHIKARGNPGYARFRVYFDDISVSPVADVVPEIEKIIPMNNVFFNTAEWILLPTSFTELNKQLAYLKQKPNIKVEISGHTDNVGNDADNQVLSENRAKAVVDYFIENGILPQRLTYKGYGRSKPIDTNETDQGRAKNRRVEMKIISE